MNSKRILITGASSGFGLLTVLELLRRGHRVIAGMRGGTSRLDKIELMAPDSAGLLRKHLAQENLWILHMDAESESDIAAAKNLASEKFKGQLDVLINNAGIGVLRPLMTQTPAEIRNQFDVNYFAAIQLIHHFLPELILARGRIVNVSSIAGRIALPMYGAYSATKYALEASSEALSYELERHGIQVALVEPGGFRTQFNQRVLVQNQNPTAHLHWFGSEVEKINRYVQSRMNWGQDPQKVANLVSKLCVTKKLRLRYVIGSDARLLIFLKAVLPEIVIRWLTRMAYRRLF